MADDLSQSNLRLHYTIVCEDVRLEINHKLSLMGIFYAVAVPQFPVTMLKLVVLNHWSGEGKFLSEVRILSPDRSEPIAVSPPSPFEIPAHGFADNVTVFANVAFPAPGNDVVQTLINSTLFSEQQILVADGSSAQPGFSSETIQ